MHKYLSGFVRSWQLCILCFSLHPVCYGTALCFVSAPGKRHPKLDFLANGQSPSEEQMLEPSPLAFVAALKLAERVWSFLCFGKRRRGKRQNCHWMHPFTLCIHLFTWFALSLSLCLYFFSPCRMYYILSYILKQSYPACAAWIWCSCMSFHHCKYSFPCIFSVFRTIWFLHVYVCFGSRVSTQSRCSH